MKSDVQLQLFCWAKSVKALELIPIQVFCENTPGEGENNRLFLPRPLALDHTRLAPLAGFFPRPITQSEACS